MMKFDETLQISLNLLHKTSSSVRGSVRAPHSLKRSISIAAFTSGQVDADYVGADSLIDLFLSGKVKCDICVCDKSTLPMVAKKIGKILGRKRMMPDSRFGTVSDDLPSLIQDLRHGIMFFRSDKSSKSNVVHSIIGKVSMDDKDLIGNLQALASKIVSSLPEKSQIKEAYLSKTMGKAVPFNMKELS